MEASKANKRKKVMKERRRTKGRCTTSHVTRPFEYAKAPGGSTLPSSFFCSFGLANTTCMSQMMVRFRMILNYRPLGRWTLSPLGSIDMTGQHQHHIFIYAPDDYSLPSSFSRSTCTCVCPCVNPWEVKEGRPDGSK